MCARARGRSARSGPRASRPPCDTPTPTGRSIMSDHDDVERASEDEGLNLTRRDLLRLGLLTAAATQGALAFAPPGAAQTTMKLGANLIGKLAGAEVMTDPGRLPKSFNEAATRD